MQTSFKIISVEFNSSLTPIALIEEKGAIPIDKCFLIDIEENQRIYRLHINRDIIYLLTKLEKDKIYFEILNFLDNKTLQLGSDLNYKNNQFIYACFVDIGEILHKIGRRFDMDIIYEPKDYYSIVPRFIQVIVTHIESIDLIVGKSLETNFFDYKTLYFIMRSIYETYTTFDCLYTKYDDKERLIFTFYLWKLQELFKQKIEVSTKDLDYKILNAETSIRINIAKKFLSESKYSELLINKKTKKIEWEKLEWRLGKSYSDLALETGLPKKMFFRFYKNLSNFVHSSNESVVTNIQFMENENNLVHFLNLDVFFSNINLLNIVLINFSKKIEKFLKLNYPDYYSSKFKDFFGFKETNEGFKTYSIIVDSIEHN